ncbi:homeobox protein aristaless-like 4 [Platysternon megacephalum]|uniref:Homeobox protein aristaless-like 4 n=1 Tax=Platysternon megacephalum TaxID=55544 RepID=A0A4D9F7V5_9SAUR|nr:homeobox protein aristaless-like 4 [Platysternon megacephalum]
MNPFTNVAQCKQFISLLLINGLRFMVTKSERLKANCKLFFKKKSEKSSTVSWLLSDTHGTWDNIQAWLCPCAGDIIPKHRCSSQMGVHAPLYPPTALNNYSEH